MFIKAHTRTKDGKQHRYYSLVESVRTARGPQHRTLAYLGELNASTQALWRKSIAVFNGDGNAQQLEMFTSDEPELPTGEQVVQVALNRVLWERPRDFGEVYLAQHLWKLLGLDHLLAQQMTGGEQQVDWHVMAFILTAARLIAPSSELAIEQNFYPRTALDDVTGVAQDKVNKNRLYRTLDRLLPHKAAIEAHLKGRLGTLFDEPFDLLLYDLTSTYFEGLAEANPAAVRGYSRDHRSDCVQIVIGLVVTRSGLPLGYEVFDGNRSDATTLQEMMGRMESLYGKASRIWVFDRGVASEKNLEALRACGGNYLVGTPRTLLRKVDRAACMRHTEGAYLLRTNLTGESEQSLWHMYMQLSDAEAAFRTLKQDLSIRPIYHQIQRRVEAHVLVCLIAYAMYRTLDRLARSHGLAMSGRKVLAAVSTIKSGDVVLPLVDGRELRLRRVSRPDPEQSELLARLGLNLPERIGVDLMSG